MKTALLVGDRGGARALRAPRRRKSDYPNKPVKIINNSAPGSATDVAARLMAERLSAVWGQQVIVENRPGAGGSIAVRAASEAAPDGYTLYVGAASTFTALKGAPGVAPNLPIELPRDFAPIGFMTQQPMFIAVSPQLGVKSLPELIDARQEEARRIVLRHHRPRPHHAPDHGAGADARRHQAADDPLHRRPARLDGRPRHRPGRTSSSKAIRAWPAPDQRHHQGHRGLVARAAGRFQGSADRGRDAAGLRRRRLERAARAGRHAGGDHRRPAPTCARRSTTRR